MDIAIAGAGIGGLTAALSLHANGLRQVTVFEAAREIRQVGVGLNLPPHAVRELVELGLGEQLEQAGVRTAELAYYDPAGKLIWAEPRGIDAGYRWPQYSIHRGKLQDMLAQAVRERLGQNAIRTGTRLATATNIAASNRVLLTGEDLQANAGMRFEADLVIVADGIRSALRDHLAGQVTPLATNGWVMYRGSTRAAPFLSGHSMVIVGDEHQRIVVYPIGDGMQNWLLVRPRDASTQVTELGNWNLEVSPRKLAEGLGDWRFAWLDIQQLVADAPIAWEYPMADIDPLPRWIYGHCALLGDAAHAMYPFGSNGASQAIIDARVLAHALATESGIDAALQSYDRQRRLATAQVQTANRHQAGDVMAKVSSLARRAAHADAATELLEVERRYKQLAGFDVDTLNQRASWSVPPGAAPASSAPD
ncbi:FAD-dependent monooxygenase [Lacisediminimonas sp.]|uniref:FAD-dependent monooxygenase n=1 Tax=Lacisediminimonas sp. TaxID=3060582 RepID=UPI00271653EC|nr:FAD-dependent monooxygenase [Lacisediminimonas sp.]MDO8298567.1 FAD-dependent monooxygenase [Lacisediminimonas sp.]